MLIPYWKLEKSWVKKYLAAFIMKTADVLQLSLKNCSNIAISTMELKWVVHRAANKYRRLCLAGW